MNTHARNAVSLALDDLKVFNPEHKMMVKNPFVPPYEPFGAALSAF